MNTFIFVAVPYLCLLVFVVGHVWRWRYDQFGWTSHTSQLLEGRILRWGSPLFHFGALGVIGGHALGLLVPASFTHWLGIPEHAYHLVAVWGGVITGTTMVIGLALLCARRLLTRKVRLITTGSDRVLFPALVLIVVLGMTPTIGINLLGEGFDYRESVSVWFRGIFWFNPQSHLMADIPLLYQLHAIAGFLFLAMWPFTRLVHVWSVPLGYLWRPYVVYRSRGTSAVPDHSPSPAEVRDRDIDLPLV